MSNNSSSSPPRSTRKTSLGYILSSPVPSGSFGSSRSTNPPSPPPRSSLLSLPRPVLSLIAFHLVRSDRASKPSSLIPLISTCHKIHSTLSLKANPKLYRDLYAATFDTGALLRRYAWICDILAKRSGGKKKAFDLFGDPKSWAEDYKARWEMSKRMRKVVENGTFEETPSAGDDQGGKKGRTIKEMILPDLWVAWFLVTENDGTNTHFLRDQCHFYKWVAVYVKERLVNEAMVPGYPEESGEKALGIWCALLSGTDVIEGQTPAEVDEAIFMLRPYVFACAQYDITYAPWHHRQLPTCPAGCTCTQHTVNPAIRSKSIPYERFGYTWQRAPPHLIAGAYLVFLRLLERQSILSDSASKDQTAICQNGNGHHNGHSPSPSSLFTARKEFKPSDIHDTEWQRNSVCQDPHSSAGLPALTFHGEIQGTWKGKFLFYNFELYRQVLEGDMRAVYTGDFAVQPMELELIETIIKVKVDEVGGNKNVLSAGYEEYDDSDGQDPDGEKSQRDIREGCGYEGVRPDDDDEEGWTKEILLSGRAMSNWGPARIRGRVRSWDGLVIIMLNYTMQRHPQGRWLWRGYLHTGGYMLGRWRDTFTPTHLQAHEGAFGVVRVNQS